VSFFDRSIPPIQFDIIFFIHAVLFSFIVKIGHSWNGGIAPIQTSICTNPVITIAQTKHEF